MEIQQARYALVRSWCSALRLKARRRIEIGDDLAERPTQWPAAELLLGTLRQQREHKLGEAVGLLQVRIAGEDEVVEPECRVFLDACGDGLRIAHQRRARATAHQAHAGPQVG